MTSARPAVLALTLAILAACAEMPSVAPMPMQSARSSARPEGLAQFIALQRAQAHRLAAEGLPAKARLHWRYVAALLADDAEATREIARLGAAIRARTGAFIAQGEAALTRGRNAEAQTAFLKALALDGGNERARSRLREIDTRAVFTYQDRKDIRARAARLSDTESPEDE